MYQGGKLKDAITLVKNDHLFWPREVLHKASALQTSGNTSGAPLLQAQHHQGDQPTAWQPSPWWSPNGKGKKGLKGKKGKGKGKGKGDGKGRYQPYPAVANLTPIPQKVLAEMATRTTPSSNYPQGQEICRNFINGTCPGWCGRAHHLCPRKLSNGQFCFGPHRIRTCLQANP